MASPPSRTTGPFDVDLLNPRVTRTSVAVSTLLVADLAAWTLVLAGALPMPGMQWLAAHTLPMTAPGAVEDAVRHTATPGAVARYLLMWGVMMVAMMLPAMTRFAHEYVAALRGSATAVGGALLAFFASYSVIWALTGVVPLAFDLVLPGGIYGVTSAHPSLVVGVVCLVSGLYQLSTVKQSRVRTVCGGRDPRDADPLAALRAGARMAVTCAVSCFAFFFLLMVFLGEMNPFWMVALTIPVTVEHLPSHWAREVSLGIGLTALLAGLALILTPLAPPVAL